MIENKKYIHWMAMLGLVVVIGLQGVWLYNSYQSVKEELEKECFSCLDLAMYQEQNIISQNIPNGAMIMGGPPNDSIPITTLLYDGISKLGLQYSLSEVDSLAGISLEYKGITCDYVVNEMNPITGEIYHKSKEIKRTLGIIVESKIVPIRLDYSLGLQLILVNPIPLFFSRMGLLLAATAVMMLFVICCIVWQVKILRRMSRVLRIREDFSYAMVHDMKTPLSSIIMTVELLHQGRLDDKPQLRERYFSIAEAEARHLLALTNKVLTLSKLEHHRLRMNPEALPLRPVVEELAVRLAPRCPKPLRISYDLQVPDIHADAEYWPEVMQNLLDNAVKYTRPDAEAVEIHVSTRAEGRHTELRIRDNGRGIPRRHLRTIFDKYERASAERSRQPQDGAPAGFGLGLSFVHQVVRAHGGTIRAESEEGRWTEFVIRLPEIQEKEKNKFGADYAEGRGFLL